jgi:broad specificity phosphatase PhoE
MAPGAESHVQFAARAASTLYRVAARHPDQSAVVVTHGGVIRASFLAFGEAGFKSIWLLNPDNTSITEWRVPVAGQGAVLRYLGPNADAPPALLVRYNDADHLTRSST